MFSNKSVIGVVFGGKSSEHEVSIKSAKTIYNALRDLSNEERYIARPIYIDKYGYWHNYIFSESILFDKKDHLIFEERRVNLTNLSKMENIDEEPYVNTKSEYLVLIDKDNKIVAEFEGKDPLKDAKDSVRSAHLPPMNIPKN